MKKAFIPKLLTLAAAALFFTSCKYDIDLDLGGKRVHGDGNVVTENRNINTAFTAIEISRGLELEVEQSSQTSVTVIADKNLQNHITTEVNNGVLTITTDANISDASSKKIVVKLPKITSLEASSASIVTGMNTIKGEDIALSTSSAGEMKLTLEAENVSAESSSGSSMQLRGKTLKLDTNTSSGSVIDAEKLLANDIISEASSGSVIDVYPLVSLKADASSGGNIGYHNDPKTSISKESGSGGSVSKE
jgi:hypothetical protein